MPGKSKHGKGKFTAQTKKRKKERTIRPAAITEQPVAVNPRVQEASPVAPVSTKNIPDTVAPQVTIKNPYIAGELITIGIYAGILFVILIVLALVLP
jgi:hypothetical protein